MKNMKKLAAALMALLLIVMAAPAVYGEEVQPSDTQEVQAESHSERKAEEKPAAEPEKTSEPAKAEEEQAPEAETAAPEATVEATPEATAEATPEATPEVTPDPTVEPTPEATPEATPETTPEPTPAAHEAERIVRVVADRDLDSLEIGDELTLKARLSGFDGADVTLTWQVKQPGGKWRDLEGEHGDELKIEITEDLQGCAWRLSVETAD